MKNKSYFEKYQFNPVGSYSENKILTNNSNYNNNKSFEKQNNNLKISEPKLYPTLISEPSKLNKNLKNLANNNPSLIKTIFIEIILIKQKYINNSNTNMELMIIIIKIIRI